MVNVEPLIVEADENQIDFESLPLSASPLTHMAAGALAGIAEHSFTYPIDCIKTRMQILRPDPAAIYTGMGQALRRIIAQEGIGRLWRGINSVIVGAGPAHAIYFAAYEETKMILRVNERLQRHGQSIKMTSWWDPMAVGMAGAVATATSDGCMTPFDVVKQRMQIYGSTHRGVWACAKSIWRAEGLAGFFVSYPTTLISNVPFHMIQFPTYEFFRSLFVGYQKPRPGSHESPMAHVLAGGIAGGTAAFFTTPIDVVKTTLQTRNLLGGNVSGMRDAILLIFREHGFRGFIRGALPRTLTFVPGTALCWMVYEYFKANLVGK